MQGRRQTRGFMTLLRNVLGALVLFAFVPAQAQQAQVTVNDGSHIDVDLIPETLQAEPGHKLWMALRLNHRDHWHTYWKNPGDAGIPTSIAWQLPAGVSAGDIVWPVPRRFDLPGDVTDFGYTDEVFLLVPLAVPAGYPGEALDLAAQVKWLECDDTCIPGGADIRLSLPVAAQARPNTDWAWAFEQTRASQPRSDINLDSSFGFSNGSFQLLVQATEPIFQNARAITFIPDKNHVVDYLAPQQVTSQLSSLQLEQAQYKRVKPDTLQSLGGLLLVTGEDGKQLAYDIDAKPHPAGPGEARDGQGATDAAASLGLPKVFLFALLGGLILNLMPCVFPVLSLKVLGLANASRTAQSEQRWHGIAYTAGVMASFFALALLLMSLQAGGAAIGWITPQAS